MKKEKIIYIRVDDEEVSGDFLFQGKTFKYSTKIMPSFDAKQWVIDCMDRSLNFLDLLGLIEFERQQKEDILGTHNSYDESKLQHKKFPVVYI